MDRAYIMQSIRNWTKQDRVLIRHSSILKGFMVKVYWHVIGTWSHDDRVLQSDLLQQSSAQKVPNAENSALLYNIEAYL